MSKSFIRKIGLQLVAGDRALDLSNMRIKFEVTQLDLFGGAYPPLAQIQVFNLSDRTTSTIKGEYQRAILQAGYENGEYGVIFDGSVAQYRSGRASATDNLLTIMASDSDLARYATVFKSLKKGYKQADVAKELADSLQKVGVKVDSSGLTSVGGVDATGIRGKVMTGLALSSASDFAFTNQGTWAIERGQMIFTPLTGYRPLDAVRLTSRTGLIGSPVSTLEGIEFTCLMNPRIRIGGRVQIDNKSITQTTVLRGGFPQFESTPPLFADVTVDGFYRVVSVEHAGDTRGEEWYTNVVGLAVDPSSQPSRSVSDFRYVDTAAAGDTVQ